MRVLPPYVRSHPVRGLVHLERHHLLHGRVHLHRGALLHLPARHLPRERRLWELVQVREGEAHGISRFHTRIVAACIESAPVFHTF